LTRRTKHSSTPLKLIEEGYTRILGHLYVCRDCKRYFKEEEMYVIVSKPTQEGKEYACGNCVTKK